jgi:hypothetical protein
MLKLMKDCYRFPSGPAGDGNVYGELAIQRGLERRARQRKLLVDAAHFGVEVRICVYQPARPSQAAGVLGAGGTDGPGAPADQDSSRFRPARPAPQCRVPDYAELGLSKLV